MGDAQVGLRERTRRAVQGELLAIALDLFLEQGFEATTIEQIATSAGLSQRSFFRYFAGKDEVLTWTLAAPGDAIAAEVARRPADESPWIAIRRSLDSLVAQMQAEPRALRLTRMMLTGDALRASHAHKQMHWRAALADAVAPRLERSLEPADCVLVADALSGAALAALGAAEAAWVDENGRRPLAELTDVAMSAVAPLV